MQGRTRTVRGGHPPLTHFPIALLVAPALAARICNWFSGRLTHLRDRSLCMATDRSCLIRHLDQTHGDTKHMKFRILLFSAVGVYFLLGSVLPVLADSHERHEHGEHHGEHHEQPEAGSPAQPEHEHKPKGGVEPESPPADDPKKGNHSEHKHEEHRER